MAARKASPAASPTAAAAPAKGFSGPPSSTGFSLPMERPPAPVAQSGRLEKVATVLLPQPTTASVAPCRPLRIVACAAAQPASTRAQAAPVRSAIRSKASAATSFSRPSAAPMPPVAATRRVNW